MNDLIFTLAPFAVLICAIALIFVVRRSRSNGHNHDHDHGFTELPPEIDETFHNLKEVEGGCKFDPEEVRRTAFLPKPPIDLDNIPAADPRVAKILAGLDQAAILQQLKELSGEEETVLNGRKVRIRSRNSLTGDNGINLGIEFVMAFYRSHGIAVRKVPYKIWGRTYFNVEATIPGKTNKVFIYGSHLDSTAGRTRSRESIAPGAEDDGSGTIGMLQTALALSQLDLEHTVRIVHFTGEEQGLWGSFKYADQLADEVKAGSVEEVLGMFQHDMIAYSPNAKKRLDVHDEKDRNGSRSLLVSYFRAIKQYGIDLNPFDTHNYAVRNRSDHAGFLNHGWRAIMFSEEFTDENFYPWYHTRQDTVDKLNIPFFVEVIKGAIALGANVAGLQSK